MPRKFAVTLIGVYCCLFSLFFLSAACNELLSLGSSKPQLGFWFISVGSVYLALVSLWLGIGIFRLNNRCWKILFYLLVSSVSTISSFIFAGLMLLAISSLAGYNFCKIFNVSSLTWMAFLLCFLSQIIVLYYLMHEKVRACFNE